MRIRHGGKSLLAVLTLALGAALLAGAAPAAAQGHMGVFGGLNIANMGGDMDRFGDELAVELNNELGGDWTAAKGSRTGATVGAFYYLPTGTGVGLQFEGLYVGRGTRFDLTDRSTNLTAETKFKLSYLEFPILLRYEPPMSGRTGSCSWWAR